MTAPPLPFLRTRTTWLGYALLTYHTMLQALVSAIVPFLRVELDLNYSRAGLYMSANALGMALAGLSGAWLAERLGRRAALWGAAAGSVAGLLTLILGHLAWVTLAGAFVCGLCGSLCMVMVQAILSDAHGAQRAVALSEANIAASMGSFVAPLLASSAVGLGLGWRAAPGLAVALVALAALAFWRAPVPVVSGGSAPGAKRAPLPLAFWLMLCVLFFSVAVEWAVIFWSADFLEKIGGFAKAVSVMLLAVYFIAAVLGRFAASRLLRRFPALPLLFTAMAISALGIGLVWLAPWQPLRLLGLFVAGLGIGNLFPLGMIQTLSIDPQAANQASALTTLAVGLAIFAAPLVIGLVADQVGIRGAYGLALLLLASALLIAIAAALRLRQTPSIRK